MDPHLSAQDVLRCKLCKTPAPPMYCDTCKISLCKPCVGEHLFDGSEQHNVVQFEKRGSIPTYPKCLKHSTNPCQLHCKECNFPICVQCVASGEHFGHVQDDILEVMKTMKKVIKRDLQELEKSIHLKYQEIALEIQNMKEDMNKNSQTVIKAIMKHGDDWHKEINTIIETLKHNFNEISSKQLDAISKQEDEIRCTISAITQCTFDLKKLLDSQDVSLVSEYSSRIAEFKGTPSERTHTLPSFTPHEINGKHILELFGSLVVLDIKTDDDDYTKNTSSKTVYPKCRPHIDEPWIVADIHTEYGLSNLLRNVSCLSKEEVWTGGQDNILRLYNLKGELVNSVQTKSNKEPSDIALTRSNALVYADPKDGTVNIVKNSKIQTLIRHEGWRPYSVCTTFFYELLVVMKCNDKTKTKVMRYFGSELKQTIQFDGTGKPFFSCGRYSMYICENINHDICVADNGAGALVVVSQDGKLRFTYNGPPYKTKRSFDPYGIATDIQGQILTSDFRNNRIHILNQDGLFICFIDNCHLDRPSSLSIDKSGDLFVGENCTGKVKIIRY